MKYQVQNGKISQNYAETEIFCTNRVISVHTGSLANDLGESRLTLKMVLDTSLLNTQQHKVRIKDKVEQSRERSSAPPYTSVL